MRIVTAYDVNVANSLSNYLLYVIKRSARKKYKDKTPSFYDSASVNVGQRDRANRPNFKYKYN